MTTVEDARARIFTAVPAIRGSETVSLANAAGRVALGTFTAKQTQPPADLSAMDGWAVRAMDASAWASLTVIGEAAAGDHFPGVVGPGQAVRIFTGAPLPQGADAVVLQEDAVRAGDTVRFTEGAVTGRHIRRRGIDFMEGEPVLSGPRRLGARDIALLAAANLPWISVARRPKVVIVATGNELVAPGTPSAPGQIVNSNSFALAALIARTGGEAIDLGIVPDNLDRLCETLRAARGADLIVTLGGASVGDHDLVRPALEREGGYIDFWKIAMRPGKPMLFGALGDSVVLGLPGNPVSAFVCAYLFLRPAIEALQGLLPNPDEIEPAILAAPLAANGARAHYLRATADRVDGAWRTTPLTAQDSSLLGVLAEARGLIVQAPGTPALDIGDPVDFLPFHVGY